MSEREREKEREREREREAHFWLSKIPRSRDFYSEIITPHLFVFDNIERKLNTFDDVIYASQNRAARARE